MPDDPQLRRLITEMICFLACLLALIEGFSDLVNYKYVCCFNACLYFLAHVRRENNNNNYEDFENADNGHNANRDMRRRKDEISTFDFNKAQQPRTPRYVGFNLQISLVSMSV